MIRWYKLFTKSKDDLITCDKLGVKSYEDAITDPFLDRKNDVVRRLWKGWLVQFQLK